MAYEGVVEDLRACCELRTPSCRPVLALGLELDMRVFGVTYAESRTDVDKMVQCKVDAVGRFDYDMTEIFPDDYIEFEPLGLNMRDEEDSPAMPAEYLPMDRETLSAFRIPDAQTEMRLPIHLEMIRRAKETLGSSVCVMGRIAAPFSALALIYGIDAPLMGILDAPALIHDNLSFFVDHQIAFGRAQVEAGADVLWLGDCVADSRFLRPEWSAEFAFAAAAQVAAELARSGVIIIYHTCETSIPHLKLQTQLPVSAVNVGEGACIAVIKEELGVNKCLTGNFDPLLLRDGQPDEIAEATERMIRENLPGGGYVFNTGEGIMGNTPEANVEAMMGAARAAVGGSPQ